MHNTAALDKAEADNWNADAKRRVKHWLLWTLLLLGVTYFLPLRWAVLLVLFYARLANRDLDSEGYLRFAYPLPLPPRRKVIYGTSILLKEESSAGTRTRARLHMLDGEPTLSLYSEDGSEIAVFSPISGTPAEDR
jgi:hypothetical protein